MGLHKHYLSIVKKAKKILLTKYPKIAKTLRIVWNEKDVS